MHTVSHEKKHQAILSKPFWPYSIPEKFHSIPLFYFQSITTLDRSSQAISHKSITGLCLLNLSVAFDSIDHSILSERLSYWFLGKTPSLRRFVLTWWPAYAGVAVVVVVVVVVVRTKWWSRISRERFDLESPTKFCANLHTRRVYTLQPHRIWRHYGIPVGSYGH